jgi:hypothetical protein
MSAFSTSVEAQTQVPDTVVYRSFFLAASLPTDQSKVTDVDRNAVASHLRSPGFISQVDALKFKAVVWEFRVQFDRLVASYNAEAEKDNAIEADFWTRADNLTNDAIRQLATVLSPDGAEALDKRMKIQKANTRFITMNHDHNGMTPVAYHPPQGCQPTTNYTFSQTWSSDLTYLYTSVTVSGTSSMPAYCPRGALHTPRAYNSIAGSGSWQYGGAGCPSCYISITNNQQALLSSLFPNQDGTIEVLGDGQVVCTIAGTFFNPPGIDLIFEEAETYSKNVSLPTTRFKFNIISWCRPQDTPPDYNPNVALTNDPNLWAPYFGGISTCERPKSASKGSPWLCVPNPTPPGSTYAHTEPTIPQPCVNKDSGTQSSDCTWWP